jgi:predicted HD phosphohydrolase
MTTSRTALRDPAWRYIERDTTQDMRAADWAIIEPQRAQYMRDVRADHALRLLEIMREDGSFGYQISMYRHCIQSATLALRDGRDEEYVVMSLLHDVGFTACTSSHGPFAARLMGPYISEANFWLLEHHQLFQDFHCHELEGCDRMAREKYRGHPHFVATAEFVAHYDQNAIAVNIVETSIDVFVPMVRRIFSRAPRSIPLLEQP